MSLQTELPVKSVYTHPKIKYNNVITYFLNPTFGIDMNINGAFSGTPDGVHNGTDSALWTGSGSRFDFTSTAKPYAGTKSIEATAVNNGDVALFTRSTPVASGSYVALSGFLCLSTTAAPYSARQINVQFRLAGVDVGVALDLYDFTNAKNLSVFQKFTVLLSDFGVIGNIDEITITVVSTEGGSPSVPDFFLDNIQLEESGADATFEVSPTDGDIWEIDTITLTMAGSGVTDAIPPNTFHNLTQLINGLQITRTTENDTLFVVVVKDNIGILQFPNITKVFSGSDGADSWMTFRLDFPKGGLYLDSRVDEKLKAIVFDDLSSLSLFRMSINASVYKIANNPPINPSAS